MHMLTRTVVAATVVTLSMLGAARPAHALTLGETITVKGTDGSVMVCSLLGCVVIAPPCQCSPKSLEKVATPPRTSGTAPTASASR